MSNEGSSYLTRYGDKHSCRYSSADNTIIIHEHLLHPQKVTVWCGMMGKNYWSLFFQLMITDERAVTVTGDSFRKCIQEYLLSEIEDQDMHRMWFQQDGASAHTARVTI